MYHVHVTDCATSPVSAAVIVAQLTLRGGQLKNRVVVSASTMADAANDNGRLHTGSGSSDIAAAAVDAAGGRTDVLEVLAAAACLQGLTIVADGAPHDDVDEESAAAGDSDEVRRSGLSSALPPDVAAQLRPYPYFSTHFANVEQGLQQVLSTNASAEAKEGEEGSVGYFDFIVAADLAAYDAVLDYYNSRRCAHFRQEGRGPRDERLASHVAIVHIASQDVARAGALVQRFLSAILPAAPATAAGDGGGDGAAASADGAAADQMSTLSREAWMDAIDSAVASFSQLLGVDVLVTIL